MAEAQVQRTAQDQGRDKGRRPILGEGARQRLLADMPLTERRLLLAASRPPCWRAATARRSSCCTVPQGTLPIGWA
jgi:hypothetical protein